MRRKVHSGSVVEVVPVLVVVVLLVEPVMVVVVLVVVVVVVLVVVVVVVVVVGTGHCGGGPIDPLPLSRAPHEVGSLRGTLQKQVPALHAATTAFEQFLSALPVRRPPSMTPTSSEQSFELQAGGAALAPETKTPAASATAANVTTARLVMVEPPRGRSELSSISALPPHATASTRVKEESRAEMPALRRATCRAGLRVPERHSRRSTGDECECNDERRERAG